MTSSSDNKSEHEKIVFITADSIIVNNFYNDLIGFLKNKGIENIILMISGELSGEQKRQFTVHIDDLLKKLQGVVSWGYDDYYISDESKTWQFVICHHSDVHISGSKKFVNYAVKYFSKRFKLSKT